MKKIKILSIIMATLMLLVACSGGISDNTAVKVNDTEVSMDYFNKTVVKIGQDNGFEEIYGPEIWDREIEPGVTFRQKFEEQILDIITIQELVYAEAVKKGVQATDEEIQSEYDAYADIVEKNPDYKAVMEKNNIDEEFVKEHLKKTLTYSKYIQSALDGIEITDADANEYYNNNIANFQKDEVRARHILVMTRGDGNEALTDAQKEEKLKLAQSILERAKAGEDFAELAKEFSDDPGSAANGGDLGFFGKGQMVPEFEAAAFALNVGEISNIIETDYGYHIIKLEDKNQEVTSYEDVADILKDELKYNKYIEQITELRNSANIVLNSKFEAK